MYDILFMLLGNPNQKRNVERKEEIPPEYANEGDAEMYERLCDLAKSHNKIKTFAHLGRSRFIQYSKKAPAKPRSSYIRAFCEGILDVLQCYQKQIVEVEHLMLDNPHYTLTLIFSRVERFHRLFNTLNRLIVTIKERNLEGCQVLSLIHQSLLNGDAMVREKILIIFKYVNNLFINQLCCWLLYGKVSDAENEFLICPIKEEGVPSESIISSPSSVVTEKTLMITLKDTSLECGYCLNPTMIPSFMPLSLAQDILFIGKTVILFGYDPMKQNKKTGSASKSKHTIYNFDNALWCTIWKEREPEFHEKLYKLVDPGMFETNTLRSVIREIKECVTKHLWTVAVEEAQLLGELRLMKDFYLLGRGELFLELLRLSSNILENPTTRTSTRDMNHAFHLAARAVLLSDLADIDKFSFELPYVKPNVSGNSDLQNDTTFEPDGWSTIILKYHFKWPLHLLFTPEVLARYNDMFRLLLRIKKTQHDLHALWKTHKHSRNFVLSQLHNKLMFLMDNLQHYLQADVLETNYSKFMEEVAKTNDFENLKRAHATFLADVLNQSFLTEASTSDSDTSVDSTDSINNPVLINIVELLKLCDSFCSMGDDLDDYRIASYDDRFNKLVKKLMELLVMVRGRLCGVYLARLLMRLDYNRWLSGEARLAHSLTNMLTGG